MQKGFLASLFDPSFSSLITTKVIKVIYMLSMILIGLGALVLVIAAFADERRGRACSCCVVVAPFVSLLYLIYTRVLLEVIIALFRIMETNVELVQLQRAASSGPAAPSTPPPAPPTPMPPPAPEAA